MPTRISARTSRGLAFVVLLLTVAGCSSSTTGPQTTPSQYAGNYAGIIAGATASGTVAITVGQPSDDMARGPLLHPESNPDAVTVTLQSTTFGTITLTGTISGSTVTVTSTSPPASCTITFTTTGATGSCTVNGATLSLAAALSAAGIEAVVYCGTQSTGGVATVAPNATLGALVSGSNMYLLVAPPTGSPTLYSGTLSSGTVALMSSSGGAVYNGTEASGGTTIGGTIGSSSASWSVATPCTSGALTLTSNAVAASATVGSTTSITPAPITISNGGSGTLGLVTYGTTTYTPSASTGWLQVDLTSPTTVGGTLSFSISPTGLAAGSYQATLPVTGSLATGSPQTVTVTLTINAVQAPPTLTLSLNTVTLNTTPGTAPAGQSVSVTSSGGTASGLSTSIAYGSGSGWLTASIAPTSTTATLSVAAPGATTLAAGSYSATVTVSSTTTGVASVQLTVHLNIVATPVMSVLPSPVNFSALPGGTPAPQTASVTSTNGPASGLVPTIAYNAGSGWLTASIAPSATPATLSLAVPGAASLAIGNYSATVTIASTTSGVASIRLTVNLSVQSAASTGWIKTMWSSGYNGTTGCGIQSNNLAYCWTNDDGYGTMGNSSTKNSPSNPQPVYGGIKFAALAGGINFTCGIATSGAPWCWGSGTNGELGNGLATGIDSTPQLVADGLAFDSIAGSLLENACGLTAAGAAYCWGANGAGELGNDTTGTNTGLVPQLVVGGHVFVQITSGNENTCAIDNAGAAWCWGLYQYDTLNGGFWMLDSVPQPMAAAGPGLKWMQLAASEDGVCGLTTTGAAYCWGPNGVGELGAGLPRKLYTTPQAVVGGHTFTSIVTGPCAIEAGTGKLFCWGYGAPTGVATSPTQYAVGLTFSQISQNGNCGITNGATNNTRCTAS